MHVTAVNPGFVATEGFPQDDLPSWAVMSADRVADAIVKVVREGIAPEYAVPRWVVAVPGLPRAHASPVPLGGAPGATDRRASDPGEAMTSASTAPVEIGRPETVEDIEPDLPWIVIVWNDPINLMSYVTWVLQKLFGYPRAKAEKLMWDVHTKGKAVVSNGTRDEARVRRRPPARLRPLGDDAEGPLRCVGAAGRSSARGPVGSRCASRRNETPCARSPPSCGCC